jgi:molybdopterin converting factor small subunit
MHVCLFSVFSKTGVFTAAMGKIKLVFLSWISNTLNVNSNNEINIDTQSGKNKTVKDVLCELGMDYPLFGEKVFDMKNQRMADGVNILLNGSLILSENGMDAALNDGDILTLLPLASGG